MTRNHYFNDTLERWCVRLLGGGGGGGFSFRMPASLALTLTLPPSRQEQAISAAKKKAFRDGNNINLIQVDDLDHHQHMSNFALTIQDLHNNLQSYYKVARRRFVDSICMQAAGYYLINGPETPMKLFSPSFVTSLTEEQLDGTAGEEAVLKRRRKLLKKEIGDLQTARRMLL